MTAAPTTHTVEQVVRQQLSQALGGVRGMLEAAVPTIMFTVVFITRHDLKLAIVMSLVTAGVLLVARLVQRSSIKYVANAFFGIGLGALFAYRAARGGGDAGDQALAYFLPGLLYNLVYALLMMVTIAIRWPIVGGLEDVLLRRGQRRRDPTAWHDDPKIVRLCSRLHLAAGVAVPGQGARAGPDLASRAATAGCRTDSAVAALGVAKLAVMGCAAPGGRAGGDGVAAGTQPHADEAKPRASLPSRLILRWGLAQGPAQA